MSEQSQHIVYSTAVIEFVAVANDFCVFLEETNAHTRKGFLLKAQRYLPLLYLKALLLPELESVLDEESEKFVTEEDYETIRTQVVNKLGRHDDYEEVFDPVRQETEGPVSRFISEDLADIYQDLKDFLMLYRIGNEDLMNDGLWVCLNNFETYWGQRLVNVLRAVHNVVYSAEDIEEEEEINGESPDFENLDTSNWIISKRFKDFKDKDE